MKRNDRADLMIPTCFHFRHLNWNWKVVLQIVLSEGLLRPFWNRAKCLKQYIYLKQTHLDQFLKYDFNLCYTLEVNNKSLWIFIYFYLKNDDLVLWSMVQEDLGLIPSQDFNFLYLDNMVDYKAYSCNIIRTGNI